MSYKVYSERTIAIATNCHFICKYAKEYKLDLDDAEVRKAATWNYNKFGFGYVSLDKYLCRSVILNGTKRLYAIDSKLWYLLLKIIFKRDNYTCAYCGKIGGKLEGDHIVPISKGGSDDLNNLTTSCRQCNRQKKDKTVSEFLRWKQKKLQNNG